MYKFALKSHLDFVDSDLTDCAIHNSLSFLNSLFLCTQQQEEINRYDINRLLIRFVNPYLTLVSPAFVNCLAQSLVIVVPLVVQLGSGDHCKRLQLAFVSIWAYSR